MNKVLNGDKSVVPASGQIYVPTKAIDKTNVDEFCANLKNTSSPHL